jgi:hypothetical protein
MISFSRTSKVGLVAILALGACSKSGSKTTTMMDDPADTKFSPKLAVVDEVGGPVRGAHVTFGDQQIMTDENGEATLPQRMGNEVTVATIEAPEFAPITRSLVEANSSNALRIVLRGTVPTKVESAVGGRVESGPVNIDLPSRGYVKVPGGEPYVGDVTVRTATIPPAQDMIGVTTSDLLAETVDGPVPVQMRQQVSVSMEASDGNKVGFAAGQRAGVKVVLEEGATDKPGDKLPMWSLNHKSGFWEEVSACTVEKGTDGRLACLGQVEHFSLVGIGKLAKKGACVTFTAKKSLVATHAPMVLNGAALGFYFNTFAVNGVRDGVAVHDRTYVWGMDDSTMPVSVTLDIVMRPASSVATLVAQRVSVQLTPSFAYKAAKQIPVAERYDPNASWKCQQVAVVLPQGTPVDSDGDGVAAPYDCNDSDKTIHPGAVQIICDGKDHDCSGKPDVENLGAGVTVDKLTDEQWNFYCGQSKKACAASLKNEVSGNKRDENCDGFLSDADKDGFLTKNDPAFAASGKPADCNDNNKDAYPGAPAGREVKGNDVDEDCDGIRSDVDGDSYPSVAEVAFAGRALTVKSVDCNDADPEAHPGANVTDLPLLAAYYENGKRLPTFCELFNKDGQPSAKLRYLMFRADRNCDGYLEDLDGDGRLVSFGGNFGKPNTGPFDPNDLDPRIKAAGDPAPTGDPMCAVSQDLTSFGGGKHQVCPRLFNTQQDCIEATRKGVKTGEFLCVSPDYKGFTVPPNPLDVKTQYGPCSTTVLADCSTDPTTKMMNSLCGGPITFAPEYIETLKAKEYDVTKDTFHGFCMPVCGLVPGAGGGTVSTPDAGAGGGADAAATP